MAKFVEFTTVHHKIMNFMWKNVQSSRNELGKHLHVDPSTISRNINLLTQTGIVKTVGESPASSKGGRKTRILALNEEWKKILGISIEQGEVTSTLTTLRGRVLKKEYMTMDVNGENIIEIIEDVYFKYKSEDLIGISIATPGIVSTKEGAIELSTALKIKKMPIVKMIENKLKVKTIVMNNANAAAASHFMNSKDLVYFIFSIPYCLERPVGIGAGIVINGEIHEGFNYRAGEFWRSFSLTQEKNLTVNDLKNEAVLKRLRLKEFVDYFSDFLEIAVDIVDPELYIVGGDITMLPTWVGEELISVTYKKIPFQVERSINGVIDTNGTFSIAKGAALGFSSKMMNDFNFARQIFRNVREVM
ncbi:ROK family protein [Mesoaciditoga sp.]